jgi:hypothetical protein
LEPTPVGRVRVRRVPALGGILPRAARLTANPLGRQILNDAKNLYYTSTRLGSERSELAIGG